MITKSADKLFSEFPSVDDFKGTLLQRTKGDKFIWGVVIVLAVISILIVYSATGSLAYKMNKGNNEIYLFKQVAFMVVGLLVIYFLHRVNYTIFSKVASILFLISIPLLIYTFFFGSKINDGSRWIRLPVINMTFQSSDFARLALFMYISRMLSKKQDVIKDYKTGFLPIIIPVAIICLLIAPANLSTALLTGATSLLLMFIGRVSVKHIMMAILVAMIPVAILVSIAVLTYNGKQKEPTAKSSAVSEKVSGMGRFPTWIKRVQDFIYAKDEEIPYQVKQANIAIANGGFLGLGPGNSKQRNFLPHCYSDYVYATILEEYGLAGGIVIVVIYLAFLMRGIKIFKRCPFAFGAFLAMGLSFTLAIQALSNMAVNVGIVPVTGVTLPLVSMGGSSFLFTCAAIGIILSVARNVEQLEGKESEVTEQAVAKADAAAVV